MKANKGLRLLSEMAAMKGEELSTDNKTDGQITEIAEIIKLKHTFITFRDTEEIYYYKDGIYVPYGKAIIEDECIEAFNEVNLRITIHYIKEVINLIKITTHIDREEFDKYPKLLCFENGIYNIETKEFINHSPEHYFFNKLPVCYKPEAKCPKINKFLTEILRPEDIINIFEIAGYCLYRDYPIHKIFLFNGGGANGKSTLLHVFEKLLGKNNCANISLHAIADNKFAAAKLYSKMLNVFADLPSKDLKDTGVIKMLTGGDSLSVEKKFKDMFEFSNYAKLVFSANQLPAVWDDTDAFYRRLLIINCPNQFLGENANMNLKEELTVPEELSGFLNMALKALEKLLEREEFSNTTTTEEIRETYIKASSPILSFIKEMLTIDEDGYVEKQQVYNSYRLYCAQHNYPIYSKDKFGKEFAKYVSVYSLKHTIAGKSVWCWRGIKIHRVASPDGISLNDY